jgi:hypothetical protein
MTARQVLGKPTARWTARSWQPSLTWPTNSPTWRRAWPRTGHLATEPDPSDRRVRIVRRTPLGQKLLDAVLERNLRIEKVWAEQVGHERYRVFRGVLEELALESLLE